MYAYIKYISSPVGRLKGACPHPFFPVGFLDAADHCAAFLSPALPVMEITSLLWWMARFCEICAVTGSPERRREDSEGENMRGESKKNLWGKCEYEHDSEEGQIKKEHVPA